MSDIDNQGNIYLFKVNNNKKTLEKVWHMFKLTIKTTKWRHWRHSAVLLLTLNICYTFSSSVSIVDFEQVNVTGKCTSGIFIVKWYLLTDY